MNDGAAPERSARDYEQRVLYSSLAFSIAFILEILAVYADELSDTVVPRPMEELTGRCMRSDQWRTPCECVERWGGSS